MLDYHPQPPSLAAILHCQDNACHGTDPIHTWATHSRPGSCPTSVSASLPRDASHDNAHGASLRHPLSMKNHLVCIASSHQASFHVSQAPPRVSDLPPHLLPWALRTTEASASLSSHPIPLPYMLQRLSLWRLALTRALLPDDETLLRLSDNTSTSTPTSTPPLWPPPLLTPPLLRILARLQITHYTPHHPSIVNSLLLSIMQCSINYYKYEKEEASKEMAMMGGGGGGDDASSSASSIAARRVAIELFRQWEAPLNAMRQAERALDGMDIFFKRGGKRRDKREGGGGGGVDPTQPTSPALPTTTTTTSTPSLFDAFELEHNHNDNDDDNNTTTTTTTTMSEVSFDQKSQLWQRKGWNRMETLRTSLEHLPELRSLVRSLGRSGGRGPLRRSPLQSLNDFGRPGLLRSPLEAAETRGLTRASDLSRLLPSESSLLAQASSSQLALVLFFRRWLEHALLCYERDGWAALPTEIRHAHRREVRPTADRGPILLCVDTSGSMRGERESVSKALAVECMRSARAEDRDCYVYAFSGPNQVKELALNDDVSSIYNLLDFLESTFNGGTDFHLPMRKCLDKMNMARWSNADILLVSDGELRPLDAATRGAIEGAKERRGLRVHALILGGAGGGGGGGDDDHDGKGRDEPSSSSPPRRADPTVLRSLCTHRIGNGLGARQEVLLHVFDQWASLTTRTFDWDEAEERSKRRLAGLREEKRRQEEVKRLRDERRERGEGWGGGGEGGAHAKPGGHCS